MKVYCFLIHQFFNFLRTAVLRFHKNRFQHMQVNGGNDPELEVELKVTNLKDVQNVQDNDN